MIHNIAWRPLLAGIIGLVVGSLVATIILNIRADDGHFHSHGDEAGAYHIHADFVMMVNGNKVNLSSDEFMSVADKVLHPGVHLHDNNDAVIHFHARDITLVEFLSSLDITLTSDCLTVVDGTYCTNQDQVLQLYVNGKNYTNKITTYVPYDEDRILLYYGTDDTEKITNYVETITQDACLYSGTCPERGTPPPEACGLTCEL